MLTKECHYILSGLKVLTENTDAEFSFLMNTTCFCLSDNINKIFDYSLYESEILSIMSEMKKDGYIENTINSFHFRLTQKALHRKQFGWYHFYQYMSDKWISILALIISVFALLKSYAIDIDDIITLCKRLSGR